MIVEIEKNPALKKIISMLSALEVNMLRSSEERNLLLCVVFVGASSLLISLYRRDILWITTSILYMVLMWGVSKIEMEEKDEYRFYLLKNDLFLWTLFPLLLGASGIARVIDIYFIFRSIFFAIVISILGFTIILNLEHHTSFRPNFHFTIVFVILFTIGAATILEIGRFISDQFLGTELLEGNLHFMSDLLWISIFSIFIGNRLKNYLKETKAPGLERIKTYFERTAKERDHKEDFLKILNLAFCRYDNRWFLFIARILQIGILVTVIYGMMVNSASVAGWAIFSFLLTIYPDVFSRDTKRSIPPLFTLWVSAVLFIYSVGRPLGFYQLIGWWAEITHLLSGTVVAVLIFLVLVYVNKISKTLYIIPWMLPLFVLIFMVPVGVIWEIGEFLFDLSFGTRLQAGLEDTVYDLIFDVFGALVSIFIAYLYFPPKIWDTKESS